MKVVVVHVLPQCVGHGAVTLIGVHDCRKDVLLASDNFDCSFVRIHVELLCKVIAAVVEKVRGVDVKDQFSEFLGIGFQTAGGDHAARAHLLEHFSVTGGRSFEVDIERGAVRDNILIDIGSLFALVVRLRIGYLIVRHSHVSCAGTVNTVASCHRQFTS